MTERRAIRSARPISADGRYGLILPDDTMELVDPDLTDEELAERYALDKIVHAPKINFCDAIHLDGPLAGETGYAINELGSQSGFRVGDTTGTYQVTRPAEDGIPAELSLVELNGHWLTG